MRDSYHAFDYSQIVLILWRALLAVLWLILCTILGSIYSLLHFRGINNVHFVAQLLAKFGVPIMGVKLIRRGYESLLRPGPYLIVANHQHNIDVFIHGTMVPPRTITIGKKEIIWIPFFGFIYYITGNLFIDRKNIDQAKSVLEHAGRVMNEKDAHIWLFPEGTRRYGQGLGPFKKGPFHLAVEAGVPIQPIVASSYFGNVNFNRWKTGTVLVQAMKPIETKGKTVEEVMTETHTLMKTEIERLDREIKELL